MAEQPQWIWQQPGWPQFEWDEASLAVLLHEVSVLQGRLIGKTESVEPASNVQAQLNTLLQNIIESSAIEGEKLNVASVRSSIARRLGVNEDNPVPATAQTEGLAQLMWDALQNYEAPLTLPRLCQWHEYLFPPDKPRLVSIRVGQLRGDTPMQVVSGRLDNPTVHFQAPNRDVLTTQINIFLKWFEESKKSKTVHPLLRAGLAHFWFITLHPFDDGNGRLARALGDLALAQAENHSVRFYAVAESIMKNRKAYYAVLESSQKATMNITPWLEWFLTILKESIQTALLRVDEVLQKTNFWRVHAQDELNLHQKKVLNRLLDAGKNGFEGGLTASKYQALTKTSKATATRHLSELLQKKCIVKMQGGGRSTRYDINWVT